MNPNHAEALRQAKLAEERVDDVVRCAGHSRAAWDATDAAEKDGVPIAELTALRMRLMLLAMVKWFPRALEHVASLPRARDRADWYRGLIGGMRSGAAWCARSIDAGQLPELPRDETMAAWNAEIGRLEQALVATESS